MPKYQEIEKELEVDKLNKIKINERHQLERKINKATPITLLEYVFSYKTPSNYLYQNNYKKNWERMESTSALNNNKPQFKEITTHIIKQAPCFIEDIDNITALSQIVENYKDRIRDIETWKPKRTKTSTVLKDILQHLFAKYPVPSFLINGFIKNNMESILLYQHIGMGKSIKKFPFLPEFILNNKTFHHIQTTPDHCSFNEAFRRAQILSMGGDEKLFNTIMDSKIGIETRSPTKIKINGIPSKKIEEFWLTVIQFFINNTMFNNDKISEIIDYIYDQKYITKRYNNFKPEQPNFSMKGRTPMSLLTQSDEWHKNAEINTKREKNAKEWEPINIPNHKENKYEIIQLTKTKELITEGNKMHHCVATYASSCINKSCAIFSLRKTEDILQPILTIEIRSNTISQIQAKYNTKPEPNHMSIIKSWATKNNLNLSQYIKY